MTEIYYETKTGEVYQIDEISQRLLVYVFLHGHARPETLIDPVGATNEAAIRTRVEEQLGPDATGLVRTETSTQMTLGDGDDNVIQSFVLTESGEEFIHTHRAEMSMPTELAELAKKVAALQVEDRLIDELRTRLTNVEERLAELEE